MRLSGDGPLTHSPAQLNISSALHKANALGPSENFHIKKKLKFTILFKIRIILSIENFPQLSLSKVWQYFTKLPTQQFCLYTQIGLPKAEKSLFSLNDATPKFKLWKFSNVLPQNWVNLEDYCAFKLAVFNITIKVYIKYAFFLWTLTAIYM